MSMTMTSSVGGAVGGNDVALLGTDIWLIGRSAGKSGVAHRSVRDCGARSLCPSFVGGSLTSVAAVAAAGVCSAAASVCGRTAAEPSAPFCMLSD